ncbi:hypothetical protein NPIL_177691 [Nephila pilipes]|uniref:Uncharacterized protein n=1 Tax=Nephila pilipes TaxID=299642 RepID=A0A8X6NTK3_NEPPI|nr:hypothetical protein NPIL_177691 [Nephila pilipes]
MLKPLSSVLKTKVYTMTMYLSIQDHVLVFVQTCRYRNLQPFWNIRRRNGTRNLMMNLTKSALGRGGGNELSIQEMDEVMNVRLG